MLIKLLITVILLMCSLASYASTILVLGDSLSAGFGIDVEKGWVSLLRQRLDKTNSDKITVINASQSGDTTQNGVDRLPALLKKYHPTITIIQMGGNDGLRGLSLKKMSENLSNMISTAKSQESKVILMGVPMFPNYGAAYVKQFKQVYVDVAKEQSVPLVNNILEKIADNPTLMQGDRIHPNEKAQIFMLDNVWHKLAPMITKP